MFVVSMAEFERLLSTAAPIQRIRAAVRALRLSDWKQDSKAVAEGLGFVFAIGILSIFIAGSLIAGASLFEDASTDAQEDQLRVEAERIASAYEEVDRSVRASGSDGEISEVVELPETIAGDNYQLEVQPEPYGGRLNLSIRGEDTEVSVKMYTDTLVESSEVSGGSVRIIRERGATRIGIEPIQ